MDDLDAFLEERKAEDPEFAIKRKFQDIRLSTLDSFATANGMLRLSLNWSTPWS